MYCYSYSYVVQLILSFFSSCLCVLVAFAMATSAEQVFLWHCLTVMRKNGVVLSTPYMKYDILDHMLIAQFSSAHAYPHARTLRENSME